jgi:tetratricopeptide (TPR) repeat protein
LLADALVAADEGRRAEALDTTAALLTRDPLSADAYFVRGLVQLSGGESPDAVTSLRRALYIDPRFSLASFTLGRAYDELAETGEARRAYEQALRTLDPDDDRHEGLLRQVDLGDVAAACRARLRALR